MNEQLKPCPFCHKEAVIATCYHRGNYYLKVFCSYDCSKQRQEWLADPDHMEITKKIATEEWNQLT